MKSNKLTEQQLCAKQHELFSAHKLKLLLVILLLAATVKFLQSDVCPQHEQQCLLGFDIDTYVALTVNGTYSGWGGYNDIKADNEFPLAVWLMRLNPIRLIDEWMAFRFYMLAVTLTSAIAIFFIFEKRAPQASLFAVFVWLFNPLSYRLSLDLAQNATANYFALFVIAIIVWHEQLKPYLQFDDIHNAHVWLACLLGIGMLMSHQFALLWLLIIAAYINGFDEYVIALFSMCLLAATAIVYIDASWRSMLMLVWPVTLFAIYVPKRWRLPIVVLLFVGYLLAPYLFLGHPLP